MDRFTKQLFLRAPAVGVVALISFWPGKYRLNLRSHSAVGGAGGHGRSDSPSLTAAPVAIIRSGSASNNVENPCSSRQSS
jgi:hypothetical protein